MSSLQPNTTLQGGKYKIVRFISAGGFGCTYEGLHVMLKKRVAIKEFFVKDFCNRDETTSAVTIGITSKTALVNKLKDKFIEEAQYVSTLKHDHIVSVSDVFAENGTAYYVMDYIDGLLLNDIVKRDGALSEQKAMKYILQIADALKYVHSQNRLHLDIKPANIMVDGEDNAMLIDFGTSKQYDEIDGENTSTLMGKTPGYATLEQLGNDVVEFHPSTDIYALGATLYKLLTGITPPSANLLASGEELAPLIDTEEQDSPKVIKQKISSQTFTVNGVSFEMMKVEGGTFTMGATSEQEEPFEDEKPSHQVTLSSYLIGQTQVTQALWTAVMGKTKTVEKDVEDRVFFGLIKLGSHKEKRTIDLNPSHFKGDNLPVECVSWDDCKKFISKLNSLTGKSFRLPTEAEWEFAARGGNNSNHTQYSGSDNLDDVAWYTDNSGSKTHPVATKLANELGIYDMSGNVWEWCSDWYGRYSSSPQTNPTGPTSGACRVGRGGGWYYDAWYCRSSYRCNDAPGYRRISLGLRLCLSE